MHNKNNSININNVYIDTNAKGLFKAETFIDYVGKLTEQELTSFKMFFKYLKLGVSLSISPYEYEDASGNRYYYYYFGRSGASTQRVRIYSFDGIEHFNAILISHSFDVTFEELHDKALELTKED